MLPRTVRGLARNDQLVALTGQVILQDASEVFLGRDLAAAAVAIREIEMSHTGVEGATDDLPRRLEITLEHRHQSQREGRELKTAFAATVVFHADFHFRQSW